MAEQTAASVEDYPCPKCGHSWNSHLVCTAVQPPTHGWMECPVEGCDCYHTWSLAGDATRSEDQPGTGDDERPFAPSA